MTTRLANLARQRGSRGFTLVELLLTIVLVSLLAGAIIFSSADSERAVRLEEGTQRFETLLRFARAHAASTGRKVRIVFDQAESTNAALSRMTLLWEPDPLGQPGVFQPLTGQVWNDLGLDDAIAVETPHPPETDPASALASGSETNEVIETATAPPPITFFPDGSSDSVELLITSRDPEDARKISLRLAGVTGSIRRQLVPE